MSLGSPLVSLGLQSTSKKSPSDVPLVSLGLQSTSKKSPSDVPWVSLGLPWVCNRQAKSLPLMSLAAPIHKQNKKVYLGSPLGFRPASRNIIRWVALRFRIYKEINHLLGLFKYPCLTDLSISLAHCRRVKRRSRSKLYTPEASSNWNSITFAEDNGQVQVLLPLKSMYRRHD